MKKLILITAIISGVYGYGYSQSQSKITVNVSQVSNTKGIIRVTIFNSKETFLGAAYKQIKRKAAIGDMVFEFEEIPKGEYTVSVIHDENENGELDTNFIGIPSEPYGISMDGKSNFGPPKYEDALFTVDKPFLTLSISL